jgi:uncharacterized membrane protein
MLKEIIIVALLTLTPFLELRASIPYGFLQTSLHWSVIFFIAVIVNSLLAPLLFILLHKFVHVFRKMHWFDWLYSTYVMRTQHKVHPYVDKYGVWGLALFIGVPLPGSGVYSGVLASFILGMHFRDMFKAAVVGVVIAGLIVTIVMLTGVGLFDFFVKPV